MKKKFFVALIMMSALIIPMKAQESTDTKPALNTKALTESEVSQIDTLSAFLKEYLVQKLKANDDGTFALDTVSILYDKHIGILEYLNASGTPRYVPTNPDMYRFFVPFTYYRSPMDEFTQVDLPENEYMANKSLSATQYGIKDVTADFARKKEQDRLFSLALLDAYVAHPEKIVRTETELEEVSAFKDQMDKEKSKKKTVAQLVGKRDAIDEVQSDVDIYLKKPNWWRFYGSYSLQVTQNYVSDNWYKGGESNYSLLATVQLNLNYNDKEKVQWDNQLDAKVGLGSTPSDKFHKFLFNTDQVRLSSKLGVQAAKKWYYTLSAELKTQFFHGYKANKEALVSSFAAPLDFNLSVGMDYKLNTKRVKLSVFMAPLTYAMRFIGDPNVDEVAYGLAEGDRLKHSFGSEIKPTFSWKVAKNITFESKLDYLTSYTWTRIDWENTFNFILNKYLSTKLYVHARFDDSGAPKNGSDSYFQLKELLSFGINYSF